MSSAALSIGLVWDGSFGEVASGGLLGTFRLSKSPASKMAAAPNEKIRFMVVGFAELNFMSSCRAFEVHLPGVHCGLSHSDGVRATSGLLKRYLRPKLCMKFPDILGNGGVFWDNQA